MSPNRPRFEAHIPLHAQGDTVRRDPTFWDKVKRVIGRKPDLDTQRVRTQLTTAHLVAGARRALGEIGVKNAVSLVIDGKVLFEDRDGRDDDFEDLFLAFYENESVHGRDFGELRLTVEHLDGGLHLVIVIEAHSVHERDEATATVTITADAPSSPLTPALAWARRLQFEAFVRRVRDGLGDALSDVRVGAPITAPAAPARDDQTLYGLAPRVDAGAVLGPVDVVAVASVETVHDDSNDLVGDGAHAWDASDEHGGGLVGELD